MDDPRAAVKHYNKGVVLMESQQFDLAIAEYEQALEANPALVVAHINLGNCLRRVYKTEESVQYYIRALRLEPDNVLAHFNYSISLFCLHHYTDAVSEMETAVKLDPHDPKKHILLGCYYAVVFQTRRALHHSIKGILLAPSNVDAYCGLGQSVVISLCNIFIKK